MIRFQLLLHHLENARGELVARGRWEPHLPIDPLERKWLDAVRSADFLIAHLRGVISAGAPSKVAQARGAMKKG